MGYTGSATLKHLRERAEAEAEKLHELSLDGVVTPFNQALVALGVGDRARAVSLLEQAHATDSQWLGWLRNDRRLGAARE